MDLQRWNVQKALKKNQEKRQTLGTRKLQRINW